MAHQKFEFSMPANASVVFDAFHHHHWRSRWDSLVSNTRVEGGAPCPFVGAVTENTGSGLMRLLSMRTQFISYDRPHIAAASMLGQSFPFTRWAASMRHSNAGPDQSLLIYTYTFDAGPKYLGWLIAPWVAMAFNWQTRRRFQRLRSFLEIHTGEIEAWQQRKM